MYVCMDVRDVHESSRACVTQEFGTSCMRGQMLLALGVLEALQGVKKCYFVKIWF